MVNDELHKYLVIINCKQLKFRLFSLNYIKA